MSAENIEEEFHKLSIDSKIQSSHLPPVTHELGQPTTVPIYHTSVYKNRSVDEFQTIFEKENGWVYQRLGNPTTATAELLINEMEGGQGTVVYNSGSSAVHSILGCFLKQGDHVIVQNPIYDGSMIMIRDVMGKFGVESTLVQAGSHVEDFRKEIKSNTRLIWCETPCNPLLAILDLEDFGKLGAEHNLLTVVDATFATPYLLQPIKYGVDLVMHSASKFVGGHHDLIGGCVTVKDLGNFKQLRGHSRLIGSTMPAFIASMLTRSLKTLPLRITRHSENAMELSKFLDQSPKVKHVYYPGLPTHKGHDIAKRQMRMFGGMISFEMDNIEQAKAVANNVRLINLSVSLGGTESNIDHPASMTRFDVPEDERLRAGITNGLLRLRNSNGPHANDSAKTFGKDFESLSMDSKIQCSQLPLITQDLGEPTVVPIYQTAVYKIRSVDQFQNIIKTEKGWTYQRRGNPTSETAEMIINQLECGQGTTVFNSGSSAIYTILSCFLKQGDHMVIQSPMFAGSLDMMTNVMAKFGVGVNMVKAGSPVEEFRKQIRPNTNMIWCESPCNPLLTILDLEKFGKIGSEHDLLTVVDATFATPYLVKPITFGVDLVLHSVSKFMGGHDDIIGGYVTAKDVTNFSQLRKHSHLIGSTMGPFVASMLTRSLKSLPVRIVKHCENAVEVANFLDQHPKVKYVHYPGLPSHPGHVIAKTQMRSFGAVIAFDMGSLEQAKTVANSIKLINLAVSLGGTESSIDFPALMTRRDVPKQARIKDGITDGLLRLSVGLEDVEDLKRDLDQAIEKAG